MTPRSLFNIILKVIGILFIRDMLLEISPIISAFYYFTKPILFSEGIYTLLFSLVTILVYGAIAYYLVFNTGALIDKLKLDKGFGQDFIQLDFDRIKVLRIVIFIIGGLILADQIPIFCRAVFVYYRAKRMPYGTGTPDLSYAVEDGFKILLGILLIAGQRIIVGFIERNQKAGQT
jgi:hypothetical protein